MGRSAVFLVVLICGGIVAHAQPLKTSAAKAGVISGRIFAITNGGDVKPGRMATVVLFYLYRNEKVANANPEEMNSAGMAWLNNKLGAITQYNSFLRTEGASWGESVTCHKQLSLYDEALSATVNWAQQNHKPWQVLRVDADEEGAFKIAVPHPGKYTIVATGHAGFNDAIWEAEHVAVGPGVTTSVKLTSPVKSCLTQ